MGTCDSTMKESIINRIEENDEKVPLLEESRHVVETPNPATNAPQAFPTGGQETGDNNNHEKTQLGYMLRLYFYSAFKWKEGTCSFNLIYCFVFLVQIIKVSLITDQIFQFSYDRGNFTSVVNKGHLTLRHLLLQGWTASWETLPYPPAHGDFAVYTIDDLESGINFAVSGYYNAEEEAVGYYVRKKDDNMTATIRYLTFPGFGDAQDKGINTFDITFPIDAGLSTTTVGNKTVYSYNVTKEFKHLNLSKPMKRMLSTTLQFSFHSVRSHKDSKLATCLKVKGEVIYKDLNNNGQVKVDLETLTTRIECKTMNLPLEDWELKRTLKGVSNAVMAFCIISLVTTILSISFGLYVYKKTKQFMKKTNNSSEKENKDLPISDYFRFFKFWDFTVIVSDILTFVATDFIAHKTEDQELTIETLDSQTVELGIGCVLAWTSLLRFFKFNIKFNLLFSTLYRAFWDVMAYLICVTVLFIGFWICGYVVLAPYHVKFRTPEATAATLFAIWNGDEIYATLAILESNKTGGRLIFWFSRIFIGSYVAIFTIVVINLLITLFMNAYDSIKDLYAEREKEKKKNDSSTTNEDSGNDSSTTNEVNGNDSSTTNEVNGNDSSTTNEITSIRSLLESNGSHLEKNWKDFKEKILKIVGNEKETITLNSLIENKKNEIDCTCSICSLFKHFIK